MKRPAPATPPVPASNAAAKPGTKGRNEKELQFLLDRQKEFKMAALNAKKQGDIEQAKNHLKASKVLLDFLQGSVCVIPLFSGGAVHRASGFHS